MQSSRKCERNILKWKYQTYWRGGTWTHKSVTQSIRLEKSWDALSCRPLTRSVWGGNVNLHQSENPIKERVLSGEEEVAVSSPPIPTATDTQLTLLTWYSKAVKRAAANWPRGRAALGSESCCDTERQQREVGSTSLAFTNLLPYVLCRKKPTRSLRGLTWIAPMFSISWSVLDAPKRTELTPSFRRHHAAGDQ